MAVSCEFIDIIIPISNIERVYPGGFSAYCRDNARAIGGRIWYDSHLLRDGAMNPRDMEALHRFWEGLGLRGVVEADGKKAWKDFCIMESLFGGPAIPCDWLVCLPDVPAVMLKGTDMEPVAGRDISDED